ncbi:MAG: fumarylacetoacetate hydrolase family protein [Actinomycetota bacterium]|nr:fumarylacetoacetate hydrolase family protein [Actinomycetota bacterium]
MFTPADQELERGWPGRIDGDVVVQLAAQTLQSFFTGGSTAREHATFPLDSVVMRAPVLEPPAVRLFDDADRFSFANPAAIRSPGAFIARPAGRLDVVTRVAAVIGLDGAIGGWTGLAEWRAPELEQLKDRDFALLLGPVVDTELEDGFDWESARVLAELHTRLRPGDLLGGPPLARQDDIAGGPVELEIAGVGTLTAIVA